MKSTTCLSLLVALAVGALSAATPSIKADSVTFAQNADTRLVTIGYTLEAADAIVTMDVLTNGVSIGEENFANIDGDVNRRVAPGDRLAVWHPRASWPDHVFTNGEVSVEVCAWDVTTPPDYMVVDITYTNAPVRYYVSEKALPEGGLTNNLYRTTKLVMRRIPAKGNVWTMGSPASEPDRVAAREERHLVTMTNDYYLGVFPVTASQHLLVMGTDPTPAWSKGPDSDYAPVHGRTWTHLRGASVDWPVDGHAVGPNSNLQRWRTLTGIDFDIPTSAQWEFACRAGTSTRFYYGDDAAQLGDYAWYQTNSDNKVHRVGEKIPNGFGLYDLLGGIWEWCLDWTGGITADPVVEPIGPTSGGTENKRVNRGGAFYQPIASCRSAKVNPQNYAEAAEGMGYRLLCPPTLKW